MKRLGESLPTGLHPEPSPASAGPARAPGEQPAPGVCDGCREGHLRLPDAAGVWWHYRVSDRTPSGERLARCSKPPEMELPRMTAAVRRTHDECRTRLAELARGTSAVRVLVEAHETYSTHSEPREPGDDDDEP